MRVHLVTAQGAQQDGETWQITPRVPLRSFGEQGQNLMMPMAGDEIELVLPDGQVLSGHIVSFGAEAWQDAEGNLYTDVDPADPALTLTINCDAPISAVPPGTEIWMPNARLAPAAE